LYKKKKNTGAAGRERVRGEGENKSRALRRRVARSCGREKHPAPYGRGMRRGGKKKDYHDAFVGAWKRAQREQIS